MEELGDVVRQCANCGRDRWRVYGVALEERIVHPIQCRCRSCGLVFASPRLRPEALEGLYERYFTSWESEGIDASVEHSKRLRARELLFEIGRFVASGRLLDVGCGTGAFLAEAKDAGYEVAGVELSTDGVEYARNHYRLEGIARATLEEMRYEAGSFDVVNAWHVIEHVLDLDGFIRELNRVLRPGGLLVLGTESYAYPTNAVIRAGQFARGRLPRTVTSSLHTFVFSPRVLRDCLERRGFRTLRVVSYDELSFRERLRVLEATSTARRRAAQAVVAISGMIDRMIRRGPYLRGLFVKDVDVTVGRELA